MKEKKFDAVEMKQRGAERIYLRTKGMSRAREAAYWSRRNEELRNEQSRLVLHTKLKRRAG